MVFSSMTFLTLFLPVFMVAYFAVPSNRLQLRNWVLLVGSLLFYAAGEPIWVVLLVCSGIMDWMLGILIERSRGTGRARVFLVMSIAINIGLLSFFKYAPWLMELMGLPRHLAPGLPIGISFYTFQTLSYSIDVYRGRVRSQASPVKFLMYVSMFPQLVAGPIVAYKDVENMLSERTSTLRGVSEGATRFVMGLGKKIIFANHAGAVASQLLDTGAATASTAGVWLGVVMFFFQIYFDFSGYSDMAIGLGKIIGFEFLENFDYPYTAKSITDFWRRWHISLGSFFKDYVYIPLGGNRKRQFSNILIVWMLTGIWHGATANFVIWGLYFALLLVLEKYVLHGLFERLPAWISHSYVLLAVLFSWLIFYVTDLSQLLAMSAHFFGMGGQLVDHLAIELFWGNVWILPIMAIFVTRVPIQVFHHVTFKRPELEPWFNLTVLAFSFALLIGQTFTTFIYFRF